MGWRQVSRNPRAAGRLALAAIVGLSALPAISSAKSTSPSSAAAPAPEIFKLNPNAHWFPFWDQPAAPASQDFITAPHSSDGAATPQSNRGASADRKPAGRNVAPLASATASSLFSPGNPQQARPTRYIFADIDQGPFRSNVSSIASLVAQIRSSRWTTNAYAGRFDLAPLTDATSKPPYDSAKVNLANAMLYPGYPTLGNRLTGDFLNVSMRSGSFLGPIERLAAVENVLDSLYKGTYLTTAGVGGHKQIPWFAGFNNASNLSLDTPANSYNLIPGAALTANLSLPAANTVDRDFISQILHSGTRAASSGSAFAAGVVSYAPQQDAQDIRHRSSGGDYAGNTDVPPESIARADNVFAPSDSKRATMTSNPIVDAAADNSGTRDEVTATLWSGVYSLATATPNSGKTGDSETVVSNPDTLDHVAKFGTVDVYEVFTQRNATYTLADPEEMSPSGEVTIESGMHRPLEFGPVTRRPYNSPTDTGAYSAKTVWLLNSNYVFKNYDRNDLGISGPTTFGMFAAAGSMGLVCRRHGRKQG